MKTAIVVCSTEMSLRPVAGLAALQRAVLVAQRAGYEKTIVWAPRHAEEARQILAHDPRTRDVRVTDSPPAPMEGECLVIPGDRVFSPSSLTRLGADPLNGTVQEFRVGSLPLAWRGEGPPIRGVLLQGRPGTEARSEGGAHQVIERSDETAVLLDGPEAVERAERALCEQIRRDTAGSDGVLARWFDRRLSLWLSRRIVRHTRLHPNHITVLGTCTGLLGAWFLARGSYEAALFGAVLFWLATVLDGCDGEVARLTLRESRFGQVFDVATDNLVHAAVFLGLGIGYGRAQPEAPYGWLTVLLLGGFACAGAASYWVLAKSPEAFAPILAAKPLSYVARLRRRFLGALRALMNRDFAYLLVVLAVVNRLHWFLWGAAFGSYLVCLAVWALYRWRQSAPEEGNGNA